MPKKATPAPLEEDQTLQIAIDKLVAKGRQKVS